MKTNQNKTIPYLGIVAAACLMYAVSAGLRSVYGIMLGTIAEETGIAYEAVSFAIAVGQLVFGIAQPLFGVIALKKSNTFVLTLGCTMMAVGLVTIPFCTTEWMLMVFLGILLPVGTGGVSFGIIMGAITQKLGDTKAATASGLVNASSGMGSIVFSPIIQTAFSSVGIKPTMLGFGLLAAILIPIAMVVSGTKRKEVQVAEREVSEDKIIPLMKKAVHSRSYVFLIIGFATTLGLTSAATVVPTSGLVGKLFGSENLATLFGIAFLFHQLGSFFSSWLGGICLSTTGGYVLIWCANVVLCIMAAIVSSMIKET